MGKHLMERILSGPRFQGMWRRLHKLSLHAMNYGRGGFLDESGEGWVLRHLPDVGKGRHPRVFFDVGAHKGEYSEEILRVYGTSAEIFCFEPARATYDVLQERLKGHSNIRLFNFGFGDEDGFVDLYSDTLVSGRASVYRRGAPDGPDDAYGKEQIRLATIDGFCEKEGIGHIDLLKIDVEGHELNVLKGAGKLLASNSIVHIQFEFSEFNMESRVFFRDFFDMLSPRYAIYRILSRGLVPMDKYNAYHEVFKTTNYLAVLRDGR